MEDAITQVLTSIEPKSWKLLGPVTISRYPERKAAFAKLLVTIWKVCRSAVSFISLQRTRVIFLDQLVTIQGHKMDVFSHAYWSINRFKPTSESWNSILARIGQLTTYTFWFCNCWKWKILEAWTSAYTISRHTALCGQSFQLNQKCCVRRIDSKNLWKLNSCIVLSHYILKQMHWATNRKLHYTIMFNFSYFVLKLDFPDIFCCKVLNLDMTQNSAEGMVSL